MKTVVLAAAFLLGLNLSSAIAQERPSIGDLYREASAAYEAKDADRFLTAMTKLMERRPYSLSLRGHLARAHIMAGKPARAMNVFRQIADEGLTFDLAAEGDFAPLGGEPDFEDLQARLKANSEPSGTSELIAEVPGRGQLPEGVTFDAATGTRFLGTVRTGKIYKITADGSVSMVINPSQNHPLGGIYGLAYHKGQLYAASNASPPYSGPQGKDKPKAAVVVLDPAAGTISRVLTPPETDGETRRLIGEVKVSTNGALYATDSFANVIYKAGPEDTGLSVLEVRSETANLQGLALLGDTGRAVAADYHLGLIVVDLETGKAAALTHPKSFNPSGIDGLYHAGDNSLIAVQNGLAPHRILKITLNESRTAITGAEVLAQALPDWDEPTLGYVDSTRFIYNAVSQWGAYDAEGNPREGYDLRPARIMSVSIE